MSTVFMNSENNKTVDAHNLKFKISQTKWIYEEVTSTFYYQNLVSTEHGRIQKKQQRWI